MSHDSRQMILLRRLVLAIPFLIAAILTLLGSLVDWLHLSREHTAGYAFLFSAPWGWVIDHIWFGTMPIRWVDQVVGYVMVLWVPAFLYSLCLWGLLRGISAVTRRFPLRVRQ